MKIVLANKYYFLKGGAERYLFDLRELLERHGHKTVPFAMADQHNRDSRWSEYFVSPVQTERVSFGWEGLRTVGRALYSFEAKRNFDELLSAAQPDLVHVHNIYRQISPSILPVAKQRGLPVIASVHDYALIAPNYSLFHDGEICEITKPDRYFRAVGHRCVKDSWAASLVAATENWLHGKLGLYRENVDRLLTPSRFLKAMMMAYGWPEDRIQALPLMVDASRYEPRYGAGDYVLYVGRLSQEKGLTTLVRAAAELKGIPFRIVGTGPEERRLRRLAIELGADNVDFAGFLSGEGLAAAYQNARMVCVPSEWYEVFGLVALEAYAHGKPVVASQIGGLPEVVRNGETGVLTAAGSPAQLAEIINDLWENPDLCESMGRTGRAWLESDFTPERHYEGLMEAYRAVGAGESSSVSP